MQYGARGGVAHVTTTPLRLQIGEALVSLTVSDTELTGFVESLLADLRALDQTAAPDHVVEISTGGTDSWELTVDGALAYRGPDVSALLDQFVSWANLTALESRRAHLNLHAAAACPPGSNRAVVLAGAPGAGKSTLVTGLVTAGWSYLSDELISVIVRPPATATALAYPKPITVKPGAATMLPVDLEDRTRSPRQHRWYVRPDELGGEVASNATVGAIVFPRHETVGAGVLEPLSPAEAAVALAGNVQDELGADGRRLTHVARLVSGVPAAMLARTELAVAVELVGRFTDETRLERVAVEQRTADPGGVVDPAIVTVAMGDQAVLHDPVTGALTAIDAMGAAVWTELLGGRNADDAASVLAARHGADRSQVAGDVAVFLERLTDAEIAWNGSR